MATLKRLNPDIFIALLLLGLESVLWQVNSEAPEQVGYYPKYLLLISFVLTAALLVRSVLKALKQKSAAGGNLFKSDYKSVFIVISATFLYIIAIHYAGYFVSTVLFIPGVMLYLGIRSWKMLISVSVLTTIVLYVAFNNLLMVLLPEGKLFGG